MTIVSQIDAIRFCEHALRNVEHVSLTDDDVADIRGALEHFLADRINSAKPTDAVAWATVLSAARDAFVYSRMIWSALDEDELKVEQNKLANAINALSTPQPSEDISDTLIERVARAISDANWRDEATKEFLDERWADELLQGVARKQARAALAAMGE